MAITALPTPPSRNDPANFAERGDAFLGSLPQFVSEANALQADVNAKQAAAATSATNAATSATNAANSANSAATSATAAGNSATAAATSATNASNSASGAANSAAAASTSAANAQAFRDAAAQSAADAAASRESLLALSQSIHSGAVVKAFFYDTSKDSDGGAWRKRCQDKSWYSEPLVTGKWLGQQAIGTGAAIAAAGGVAGDYFQYTSDGKFYRVDSTAGSGTFTEIFRGNRAEFPEQAAIIAESGRVIIYDLTQANCPMWMVFTSASNYALNGALNISSVFALNGMIAIGASGTNNGSPVINFIADNAILYRSSGTHSFKGERLSGRNASFWATQVSSLDIVATPVNDIAMTVFSDAPTDLATGLPIPTIAFACNTGWSIVKPDGSVVNVTVTNSNTSNIVIDERYVRVEYGGGLSSNYQSVYDIRSVTTHTIAYGDSNDSQRLWEYSGSGATGNGRKYWFAQKTSAAPKYAKSRDVVMMGNSNGVYLIRENPASPANAMCSYISNAFNTGWQVGDIRGAWLADIVPEVLTASGELVSNGTFGVDTSGWTPTSATLSVVSGAMRITATASAAPYSDYTVSTVVGRTYRVSAQLKTPMAGKNVFVNAGTGQNGSNLGFVNMGTTAGTYSFDFVATTTTTHISFNGINTFVAGDFFEVDNVSVLLADPDRSVKNSGLIVNGSLTKAAVATGAQLVAYSGFSASNYLEQPYNANLDFGTGDFFVMGWANITNNSTGQYIFSRGSGGAGLLAVFIGSTWGVICHATGATTDTGIAVTTGLHHVALVRSAGVLSLRVDGAVVWSAANTQNITNAAAVLTVGALYTHSIPFLGSLALWRIGATAPSDDQIAHIYNTEKMLFQPNAKCTIDGSSASITALAYDDLEDTLHVGTSWGRSKFRDLVRVESAATSVGLITSLSAGQSCHITGGASAARFYQPAMYLREELRRKEEARRALGKSPAFFDFDATTGQTAFTLPKGWTTKAVYSAGTLKRLGSTKDYTVSFDGFVETVNFGVAPGNAVWVSIMAVRRD